MKALSVHPFWATTIALGMKSIECRSWKTDHRGWMVICASSGPWVSGSICKHALCLVNLVEVKPFKPQHLEDAFMDEMPSDDKAYYAWVFDGLIPLVPFEVESEKGLFEIDDELISCMLPEDNPADFFREHYEPLMRFGDDSVSSEVQYEMWNMLLDDIEEEYDYQEDE